MLGEGGGFYVGGIVCEVKREVPEGLSLRQGNLILWF